jgi:hypothetical protein
MRESERDFPVSDPVAVGDAFDAYVLQCQSILVTVFGKTQSEAVEFNAWLHDLANDEPEQKLYLLHIEPRNVAEDYLGLGPATPGRGLPNHNFSA